MAFFPVTRSRVCREGDDDGPFMILVSSPEFETCFNSVRSWHLDVHQNHLPRVVVSRLVAN